MIPQSQLDKLRRNLILSYYGKDEKTKTNNIEQSVIILNKIITQNSQAKEQDNSIESSLKQLKPINHPDYQNINYQNIMQLHFAVYESITMICPQNNKTAKYFNQLINAKKDYREHKSFIQWHKDALSIIDQALNDSAIKKHSDNKFFRCIQKCLQIIENFFNNLFGYDSKFLTNTFSALVPTKEQTYFRNNASFFNVVNTEELSDYPKDTNVENSDKIPSDIESEYDSDGNERTVSV